MSNREDDTFSNLGLPIVGGLIILACLLSGPIALILWMFK